MSGTPVDEFRGGSESDTPQHLLPDITREPRCGGSRHVPGAGRWGKPWGLAPPGWSRDLHRRHGHGWREVGAEDLVGATTPGAEGA